MNNKFQYLLVFSIVSTIVSCGNSNQKTTENNSEIFNEIEKAKWLIGEWQNHSSEGNAFEIWEKKNDSAYSGKSYFVIGKDTVSSETISLEQNGNQLFYIPTVKDQNAGQPVKFTLTSSTSDQMIFENPKHDFPQKITYTRITNDSLLAEISGMMDGKQNSQRFPMKRAKQLN